MTSKLLTALHPDVDGHAGEGLSEHVILHSPVTDYYGRADVAHLLATIGGVLDEVRPDRQLVRDSETVTMISASYRGRRMTGTLDEIHDAQGQVLRATLLLRPLSALREAIGGMQAALERSPLPGSAALRDASAMSE